MDNIILQGISHKYGESTALRGVSLEIRGGELFTLLGPSGCGKTTLLRIIAGFLQPTEGRVLINGDDITGLSPEKRGMGVVFQNYALFPNMTVEQNIAYGLKYQRLNKADIAKKCAYYLDITGMREYSARKIDQLSGGQQQRVAIARALIVSPRMLLLDEPMSNLDVALREKMRQEIKDIQRRTGVTTLFITHDQQEALGISHRIAVMDKGVVQQVGTPNDIYNCPGNEFVAGFVGLSNRLSKADAAALGQNTDGILRPERLTVSKDGEGVEVTVQGVCFDGPCYNYLVSSHDKSYHVTVLNRGGVAFGVGERLKMSLVQQ